MKINLCLFCLALIFTNCSTKVSNEPDYTFVPNQIIGNFTGSGSDTIWLNHSPNETEYVQDTLHFSFPVKNPIYPYYYWCSKIINEGDLDGDGLDEFGFAYTEGMSNWFSYQVYSIREGYLFRLSEENHINHSDVIFDSLAESTGIRNKIKLKNAKAVWGDPETQSDWLGWEYRDTIVDANYVIVEPEE